MLWDTPCMDYMEAASLRNTFDQVGYCKSGLVSTICNVGPVHRHYRDQDITAFVKSACAVKMVLESSLNERAKYTRNMELQTDQTRSACSAVLVRMLLW